MHPRGRLVWRRIECGKFREMDNLDLTLASISVSKQVFPEVLNKVTILDKTMTESMTVPTNALWIRGMP